MGGRQVATLSASLLALVGCHRDVVGAGTDAGGGCRVHSSDGFRCSEKRIVIPHSRDVDILFVVDDTSSMGEEQGRLAQAMGPFVAALEAEDVRANYRIGITTTDNANPWCSGTQAEMGQLQLRSCRGHLLDFVFPGQPEVDRQDVACRDVCDYEAEELDTSILPTTTHVDDHPRARPWIESVAGATNLPAGVEVGDALGCFVPQGITGCGFESHLESMYKAVLRPFSENEWSYGFLRPGAIMVVVFLTDEADCSYIPEHKDIFEQDGDRVFWSDPDADYPTSAVCWNAGVECSGGPGIYDECHATNYAADGSPGASESEAVLQPISRYVDVLQGLENQAKVYDHRRELIVAAIAGVPEGYAAGDTPLVYADADDPDYQDNFGIGPGCGEVVDGFSQMAVPPVRLRELTEAFGEANLFSVCRDDYTPALMDVASMIEEQLHAGCFQSCAADVDAKAEGVQTECFLQLEAPGETTVEVPACELDQGDPTLPADTDLCYVAISDPERMSSECVVDGWNLEFELVQRPGVAIAPDGNVKAVCQLSDLPTVDCPDLG